MAESDKVKLYVEQNKLLWGRLQIAYLIEASALAGFYVVRSDHESRLAFSLLALSAILLLLLALLIYRDTQHLEKFGTDAGVPKIAMIFGFISGRRLAWSVPVVLLIANILLLCFEFSWSWPILSSSAK